MKATISHLLYFLNNKTTQRNVHMLGKFLLVLVLMISLYIVLFHYIMEYEGRNFTWMSGLYWTLVTMSTLGFGDITFQSDIGRGFSVIVLLSGVVFLLIMLPFTFIQFFYAPWLEAQAKSRAPRELPVNTSGHIILTSDDPISLSLANRLAQYNHQYAILVADLKRALELHDMNYKVVFGDLDDQVTYRRLRIERAALLVVNNSDMVNTNIIFTVREFSKSVPIVTFADSDDSVDILELAGASHVFQFAKMLGKSLARRTFGTCVRANVIGRFGELLIAESPVVRTSLEGKKLKETRLREQTGVTVVGMWERGRFEIPNADSRIDAKTVLVLAGSEEHLIRYEKMVGGGAQALDAPILVLGGGRVGRSATDALKDRGLDYRIVENNKQLVEEHEKYIYGSAADIKTLMKAGIMEAPSVFITTHDDDINIYLTIYCRRLRHDIQIISRATLDRNISKLYSAGADFVMSYASLAVNTVMNILQPNEILMLSEGLDIFRVAVPPSLIGKTLVQASIREKTGCSVVAVHADGATYIGPNPHLPVEKHAELILIGTVEAKNSFNRQFMATISGQNG